VVFVLLRATIYVYQPYLHARGVSLVTIGWVFAAMYVVASAVAHRTHLLRRRFGDDRMLWALLGGLATSFVLLAGVGNGAWMLGLLIVQAVANGIYSPLTKPLLNFEITDSAHRAAVLSVESMMRRAAMGVFAPLVGAGPRLPGRARGGRSLSSPEPFQNRQLRGVRRADGSR